jgi:hypothetical protein
VAAIQGDGTIIAVNASWAQFAEDDDGVATEVSTGSNYLDICRVAARADDPDAALALEAIESVLRGEVPRATLEYSCHSPTQ